MWHSKDKGRSLLISIQLLLSLHQSLSFTISSRIPFTANSVRSLNMASEKQGQESTSSVMTLDDEVPSEEILHSTWLSFLDSHSSDDCSHMFGYGDPSHKMSMLQRITARCIYDYKTKETDSAYLEQVQSEAETFQTENGAPLNLLDVIQNESPKMALAAEFKRASPSKGNINLSLRADDQATQYWQAGASIISVLTEYHWFKGSLDDLKDARMATQAAAAADESKRTRAAILRKDFVINKVQILEALSYGADTVLLIVAVLPKKLLKELIQICDDNNMVPLVEIHAKEELEVAVEAGAKVIGVNNRNLHTFEMDMSNSDNTAKLLTDRQWDFVHTDTNAKHALCALSGMSTKEDVHRYRQIGIGMVLIGESLMRSTDPKLAIEGLCLDPQQYDNSKHIIGGAYTKGTKIVKVCGITNEDDALLACRSGANLIGLIFAEKSPRKLSVDQARPIVQAVRSFGERKTRTSFDLPDDDASPISSLNQKAALLEQLASSRTPLIVGVFQNQSKEFINQIVKEVGIDIIQLHGSEGMDAANSKYYNGVPAIRVMDIPAKGQEGEDDISSDQLIMDSITNDPLAILLDTTVKGATGGGGTGKVFDWDIVQTIQNKGLPVIIAGGLTPDNVKDAVTQVRPWGIDVSSGVESEKRKKDVDKVKDFVTRARLAEVEASKGF